MSKAKKLFIGFLCLFLGAVTGCGHEGVQLETGETLRPKRLLKPFMKQKSGCMRMIRKL